MQPSNQTRPALKGVCDSCRILDSIGQKPCVRAGESLHMIAVRNGQVDADPCICQLGQCMETEDPFDVGPIAVTEYQGLGRYPTGDHWKPPIAWFMCGTAPHPSRPWARTFTHDDALARDTAQGPRDGSKRPPAKRLNVHAAAGTHPPAAIKTTTGWAILITPETDHRRLWTAFAEHVPATGAFVDPRQMCKR